MHTTRFRVHAAAAVCAGTLLSVCSAQAQLSDPAWTRRSWMLDTPTLGEWNAWSAWSGIGSYDPWQPPNGGPGGPDTEVIASWASAASANWTNGPSWTSSPFYANNENPVGTQYHAKIEA